MLYENPNVGKTLRHSLTSMNSMAHQTELTETGEIVDPDEVSTVVDPIINPDGSASLGQELSNPAPQIGSKEFLQLIAYEPEKAVNYICAIQSDASPLKRGGKNIAFRPEFLFLRSRQNYTLYENSIIDVITAEMSSKPSQKVYYIPIKELDERLGYAKGSFKGYKVFREALPLLKEKVIMEFKVPVKDGIHVFRMPWYLALDEFISDEGVISIMFTPSPFFEAFTKASGVIHGAHFNTQLLSKISAETTRSLFYLIENDKKYQQHPAAPKGEIEFSLEELRFYLGLTDKYAAGDITRILNKGKKEIDSIEGIDVSFEFSPVKNGKRIIGYKFNISDVYEIKEKALEIPDIHKGAYDLILSIDGIDEKEARECLSVYIEKNRTMADLFKSINSMNSMKNPRNKASILKAKLNTGEFELEVVENNKSKNNFNNFSQRDYDYDELEKKLLRH